MRSNASPISTRWVEDSESNAIDAELEPSVNRLDVHELEKRLWTLCMMRLATWKAYWLFDVDVAGAWRPLAL